MNVDNRKYCVYVHTLPNGKRYVGITKMKPEYRWNNGKGYEIQKRFYKDIQLYGWENISHEIICDGLTKEEADIKEKEMIKKYRSNDSSFGYNNTIGGFRLYDKDNPFYGKKHKEETKKVMKEKWDYNKHFTDETIKKISIAVAGKNNPMFGKHHTKESNMKNLISQKTRKSVNQYDLNGNLIETFNSLREAERAIGVNGGKKYISIACKKDKVCYGYKWRFANVG